MVDVVVLPSGSVVGGTVVVVVVEVVVVAPASGTAAGAGVGAVTIEAGTGSPRLPTAQLTARCAARRLQYGFTATPSGVRISTCACGTEYSELPLSPIQPICWPAV